MKVVKTLKPGHLNSWPMYYIIDVTSILAVLIIKFSIPAKFCVQLTKFREFNSLGNNFNY
jgi:hypothetical protein